MDYIQKILTDLAIFKNYGFWNIKKAIAEKGIKLDKEVLLKRIRKYHKEKK